MIGVQIEVPGEPKAAQRPKVVKRGRQSIAIKADDDVAAQARVADAWKDQVPGSLWTPEPDRQYGLRIVFRRGTYAHADLDNLAKTVLDGLNGLAYPDDHQVTRLLLVADWTPRRERLTPSTLVHVRRFARGMKGNALPLPEYVRQPD
jgi:Holliday junction resolvase RusA-like endonuclease